MCEEAGCPNIFECWEDREATFLIGGDQCTRRCDFCQIDTGKPQPLDARRAAPGRRVRRRRWACATRPSPASPATTCPTAAPGCTRETVPRDPRRRSPAAASSCSSPTSTPSRTCWPRSSSARPEVLAHNIETVPRIFKRIRPGFRYERSLDVLRAARDGRAGHQVQPDPRAWARSRHEVTEALARPARGRLRPAHHHAVPAADPAAPPGRALGQARGVRGAARGGRADSGFAGVMSGPLVRSSYRAGRLFSEAIEQRAGSAPVR